MAKRHNRPELAELAVEVLDYVFSNSGPFGGDDPAGVNEELRTMSRAHRTTFARYLKVGFAKRLSEMGFGEP